MIGAQLLLLQQFTGVLLLLLAATSLPHHTEAKCRFKHGQPDPILLTTCEARCWQQKDKDGCHKTCVRQGVDKPGSCPDLRYNVNITISPFSTVCMETCSKDSQCPGTSKCCQHDCGVTCQPPHNLHNATGLPPIPTGLHVHEKRRKKSAIIEWKRHENSTQNTIYILEVRQYTGKHLQIDHMTEWAACLKSRRNRIKYPVKPGTWYHFRVAAVNENGTSGFSHRSLNFIFSADPKPPKEPTNVNVGALRMVNGSLQTELNWSTPQSDLPIQKYVVFWSRRLLGADSVFVQQQVVSKDQTKFLLKGLQPNSSYFLQVQAIVHYGKQKLKGQKSGLVLNTTVNVTETYDKHNYESNHLGLDVKNPFWADGDLKARVTWKAKRTSRTSGFNVTWWMTSCDQRGFESVKHQATTKESRFELYSLHFNCRYRVSVKDNRQKPSKIVEDTTITFATPHCRDLRKQNKNINCPT